MSVVRTVFRSVPARMAPSPAPRGPGSGSGGRAPTVRSRPGGRSARPRSRRGRGPRCSTPGRLSRLDRQSGPSGPDPQQRVRLRRLGADPRLYLALVATRRETATATRMIGTASRHADEYVQIGRDFQAGATAKLLLSLRVARRDAKVRINGDATNLRTQLRSMVAPTGRVRDEGPTDFTSTLTQSLAVLAFARSGHAPRKVVDHLLRQRCHAGFFREALGQAPAPRPAPPRTWNRPRSPCRPWWPLAPTVPTCPVAPSGRRAAWLRKVQNPNGAWSAPASSEDLNTNTTGVAAQGLGAVGAAGATSGRSSGCGLRPPAADTRARADGGPAADDIGAIARTVRTRHRTRGRHHPGHPRSLPTRHRPGGVRAGPGSARGAVRRRLTAAVTG